MRNKIQQQKVKARKLMRKQRNRKKRMWASIGNKNPQIARKLRRAERKGDQTVSLRMSKRQIKQLLRKSPDIVRQISVYSEPVQAIQEAMLTSGVNPHAAGAGLTGAGVGVYMTELGCPAVGAQNLATDGLSNHAQRVADVVNTVAPEVTLYCGEMDNSGLLPTVANIPNLNDLNPQVSVVTASFGWCVRGDNLYHEQDRNWDNFVYNSQLPTFVIAGNEGVDDGAGDGATACGGGMLRARTDRIRPPGGGFNIITVGAHNDADTMAAFSSAMDPSTGHDKPDISGPGVAIATDNTAGGSNGTSFSTPHAAGVLANLIQELPILDDAAMAKAYMMAGSKRPIAGGHDAVGVGGVDMFMLLPEHTNQTFNETFDGSELGFDGATMVREVELREDYENVRIVVTWLNRGDYIFGRRTDANPIGLNLNVTVNAPNGDFVDFSVDPLNPHEVIEFDPQMDGMYRIRITRESMRDDDMNISGALAVNFANTDGTPITVRECIDTDGDGWGWDGSGSCRVSDPGPTACIDADGDGWGWNGVESCRVDGEPQTSDCIDADGDGWGWNGVESCRVDSTPMDCVDTDGDGWGWNGVESCRVNEPTRHDCIDSDGDGWGWDGIESCRV